MPQQISPEGLEKALQQVYNKAVTDSQEITQKRVAQAFGLGKKPSTKLEQTVSNIINEAKTPFNDAYGFLKENVPRDVEGWASIGSGAIGGGLAGYSVYTLTAPLLGAFAYTTGLAALILGYGVFHNTAKHAFMYITHPKLLYQKIKEFVASPFTPIKTAKNLYNKYIKNFKDTFKGGYKNEKGLLYHSFEPAYATLGHQKADEEKAKQKQQGGSSL